MAERAAAAWRSRAVPAAPREEEEEEGGREGQRVRPATRRGFSEVMSGACRLAPVVTVAVREAGRAVPQRWSWEEERERRESARSRIKHIVRFKCQEPGSLNGFASQFTRGKLSE